MDRLCDLLEIFDDEAKHYRFLSPYEVEVICMDDSVTYLYWHFNSNKWEFGNSNLSYESGYNYAAGYKD